MKKIYKATSLTDHIFGTRTFIAKELGVSRQAVHEAILKNRKVKGYIIEFHHKQEISSYSSQRKYINNLTQLLRRCELVIIEQNNQLDELSKPIFANVLKEVQGFLKGETHELTN